MKRLAITCLSTLMLMPSLGLTETLGEADIRRDIIGKTVYLSTPLGGELPLIFRSSGTVDGNGQAIGLGRYVKPSDTGQWWIDANRLCQKFQSWNKGKPMCFELERAGANTIKWTRDNGRTGVARIGN
ncbi:hypothetical protein [Rhizobium leguminosarum]|uniref:Uncharacterized protein n=1 Tax=Rhizobium leguminosarum TaxID=384 RepID=A0A6P0BIG1_RHILE|nr:hypothetical protein [Rhizobium leguminosarum]MBY5440276.1 hypothetical protein [Rhizobium leguminosarum]NEI38664.1 hypothetical protein [Rhizobium leguminosarum]NEI45279.1 hypothetical protein [Rhizobium leguminosarum]